MIIHPVKKTIACKFVIFSHIKTQHFKMLFLAGNDEPPMMIKEQPLPLSFDQQLCSQKLNVPLPQRSSDSLENNSPMAMATTPVSLTSQISHMYTTNASNSIGMLHQRTARSPLIESAGGNAVCGSVGLMENNSDSHSSNLEPAHKIRLTQVYSESTPESITQNIDPMDIIPKAEQEEADMLESREISYEERDQHEQHLMEQHQQQLHHQQQQQQQQEHHQQHHPHSQHHHQQHHQHQQHQLQHHLDAEDQNLQHAQQQLQQHIQQQQQLSQHFMANYAHHSLINAQNNSVITQSAPPTPPQSLNPNTSPISALNSIQQQQQHQHSMSSSPSQLQATVMHQQQQQQASTQSSPAMMSRFRSEYKINHVFFRL